MNWDQLKKSIGYRVQLVPIACRLDERGNQLTPMDDDWIVQEVLHDMVRISNVRTSHFCSLGKDHIHHFTSNPGRTDGGLKYGFLTLNVQVFIQGAKLWVKPNSGPGKPAEPSGDAPPSRVEKLRLMDERFERVKADYRIRGTPQPIIDTFSDLTTEEKADLYDRVVMWKKGRPSKSNPYRRRESG